MSYRLILVWGLLEGIIAALVERTVFRIKDTGTLLMTVVIGLLLAAVLFVSVSRGRRVWRLVAFCLVTTLTPLITVIVGNSPYYGRLVLSLDPIAIMVALVWALVLLPFAVVSAIVDSRLSHD